MSGASNGTGTGYPTDWDRRRRRVLERDGYTCQACGDRGGPYGDVELHVDHILPKSRGGSHREENLQTLCRGCHDAKTRQEFGVGLDEMDAGSGSVRGQGVWWWVTHPRVLRYRVRQAGRRLLIWWLVFIFGVGVSWQLTQMVDRSMPGHPILQAIVGVVVYAVVLGGLVVARIAV